MFPVKTIYIPFIRTDSGAQYRPGLSEGHVADLIEAIERGESLPPIVVFQNTEDVYWLGGGFHRLQAHLELGIDGINAEIRPGGAYEAAVFGRSDNAEHGLRRDRHTKRAVVEAALRDENWADWSYNQIARHCKVSPPFVKQVATEFGLHTINVYSMETSLTSSVGSQERTYIHPKTGQPTQMNTANIGRRAAVPGIQAPELASAEERAQTPDQRLAGVANEYAAIGRDAREKAATLPHPAYVQWLQQTHGVSYELAQRYIAIAHLLDHGGDTEEILDLTGGIIFDTLLLREGLEKGLITPEQVEVLRS